MDPECYGSESENSRQESDYDVDSDAESVCSTLSSYSQQMAEPSFKVFLRNFPPSVKREDIKDHIQLHGLSDNVRNIRIFLSKDKKSKGCGYITVTPPNAGHMAILILDGSLLLGKHKIEAKKFKDERKARQSNHVSYARQSSDIREKPAPFSCEERDSGLHKVFIGAERGKLPLTIESFHLQEHFRNFQVYPEQVYVITIPKTKQSKGFGFATFKSKSAAESAIKRLDGSQLHGCTLKVDFARGKEGKPSGSVQCEPHKNSPQRPGNTGHSPKKNPLTKTHHKGLPGTASGGHLATHSVENKVFVGGLPVSVQPHHLHSHFKLFEADISKVYIPVSKQQHKQYGFVVFSSFVTAERAVQALNGSKLHGSKIKVQHSSTSAHSMVTITDPAIQLPHSPLCQSSIEIPPLPSNAVCLSNLNPEIDRDSIATLCKGAVVDLYFIGVDSNCRKAIITFSSQGDAKEAIKQFDGNDFLGQTVSADYFNPTRHPQHPIVEHTPASGYMYPVKATQLAATVNEANLCSIFKAAGKIMQCCVFPSTNRYALINFNLESAADAAVAMFNGKVIDGAKINVSKKPPQPINIHSPPPASSQCQPVMVEVSNLNPKLQIHEHWKSLTDVFSVYQSAKVEDVSPLNAYVTFGDVSEAHSAADVLNQSFIGGSLVQVTVELSQRDKPPPISAKSEVVQPTDVQSAIPLSSAQCNLLTAINPSGSSLYQELAQPFMANPNVKIELLLSEVALHFTGKQDAVESASSHFRANLQRHIPVELECAQALMEVYPNLPKEMRENYGVTLVGLQEGTSLLKLDGPQGGVGEAHAAIDHRIACFQKLVARTYFVLTSTLLASARKRFKNDSIKVCLSHLPGSPEVTIYSFSQDDQERAQKIVCSNPHTKYVPFQSLPSLKELPLLDIAAEYSVSVNVDESEQKIYIRAFVRQDVLSTQERIKDCILKTSVQISAFVCSPEQMLYLRCKLRSQNEATQQVLDSLPAEVLMETNRPLHFKGSPIDIENSQKQLFEGPLLQGLKFRSFTFQVQQKFFHQIEQHVLKPIKREHPDFEYIQTISEREMVSRKGRRGSTKSEESEFTFTVLSQDSEVFDDAALALEDIIPSFRTLNVRHSNSLECVREKTQDYERQYRVRIVIPKDSSKVLIFGLTDEEAGQCLTELREHIDSNVFIEKYIKVDHSQVKYFQQKKSEEWKKLQGICKAFILFDHRRQETDTALIRVEGTVQQVRAVQQTLQAMQDLDFFAKVFTVTIEKKYNRMWLKHWDAVIREKEELYDIIIEVSKKRDAEARTEDEGSTIAYEFSVCGNDKTGLDEAEEELTKAHTIQKVITLSETATMELDKGRKEKELHVTDQYIVNMYIDFRGHRVILTAPSECNDDLEAAEGEIQRFVGNRTLMEKDIMVDDPVIGLILYSKSKNSPHLLHANQLSKPHGVSVQCLRRPQCGLRLRGSQEGIMQVEPLVRQSVIAQIQAIVDEMKIAVDTSLLPFFETPEFVHFASKIRDELHVLGTFPKSRESNKVLKSVYLKTTASASFVKLEICKGNLVNEDTSVDAIVNAANEDLQHTGGLAHSIAQAGGNVIQRESNQYIKQNGKLQTGDVVCLGAGNLACKKIIHAVGPHWVDGSRNEEQALYFTVLSCLQACQREGFESIALPAISTGVFGVPDHVCVQASIKAIRDFCKITPDTCITNVRFVLLQDFVAERFALALDSDILLGCTLSASLATTCATLSHSHTWEWMDDTGTFTPYESHLNSQLNDMYEQSPDRSFSFLVNGESYVVHFSTMLQINALTNFSSGVRRVPTSSATSATEQPSVQWMYCNDSRRWTPYKPVDSQAIERMYQSQTPAQLTINGKVYSFDFSQMLQINMETSYQRPLKRSIRSKPQVNVQNQPLGVEGKRIMITLRGPAANLPLAKSRLDDKLKDALKNGDITFPISLEKKIISIVKQRKLNIDNIDGGDHKRGGKRITFHGLSSAVNGALSAIQEEIISYHVAAAEESVVEVPPEWQPQTQNLELCPVHSGSPEWNKVVSNFKITLPTVAVIKVTCIQNKWLWERYAQHKQRLTFKNNGNVNERELFHGTRHNDPKLIYEGEDGFDMRYSAQGMWGRANYFAVNASYSNGYAYTRSDRSKEMFMVRVLTGDSFQCPSDCDLRIPPEKPETGGSVRLQFAKIRYDTVTGITGGSQVFMTYDNDKAYPAYLIQYSNNY